MQKRLVVASLEFVGHDKNTIWVVLYLLLDFGRRESVYSRFCDHFSAVLLFSRESDDGFVWTVHFFQLLRYGIVKLYRTDDAGGYNHCASLSSDLMRTDDFVKEMIDDDKGFFLDSLRLTLHESSHFLGCLILVKFGIGFYGFNNLIIAFIWSIVAQYIHNEAFLYGLLHCVLVERDVSCLTIRMLDRSPEHLQGFVLRCGGEGVIIDILSHLAPFDDFQDAVFYVFFLVLGVAGNNDVHIGGHRSILGTVCFINDDGEIHVSQ